ncbi:MAG TPA: 3-hydroxyacyl-ACP dehydratase FabZ [Erysipelothrix sp.]|nr:3-hydroxyacyl-ACP dehydratase FabZ [Erysipelothrix sp.]
MLLNSNDIQKIIPHRYPFLLVDGVLQMDETTITAIKNVSANEMHFMGHFPDKHVFPGVLIMESLAQTGAIVLLSKDEFKGKIAYFAGLDKVKFRKPVVPGDTLTLKVTLDKIKGPVGIANAEACVDGKVVASGILKFAVGD